MTDFKIPTNKLYFVAEIGVNHEGSIDVAKETIKSAKEAGASAVKFQSYKADRLAIRNSPAYWDLKEEPTNSQFELFKKYDSFDIEEYEALYQYCNAIGIDFASTPFDLEFATQLDPLLKFFKIASADITNFELLEGLSRFRKPIILSTGASNLSEIKRAVSFLVENGVPQIVLMHCILSYPTSNVDTNLSMITSLKKEFPSIHIGYSDHSVPTETVPASLIAYLLGSRVIEKHFTLFPDRKGNDHYHSFDKSSLAKFCQAVNEVDEKLGGFEEKAPVLAEENARVFARRSLVAKRTIRAGETLSRENMTCKRPNTGISASEFLEYLGRVAMVEILQDSQIEERFLI